MRSRVLSATLVAVLVIAGVADAAAAGPKLKVSPAAGTAHTAFTVPFTAPRITGSSDGLQSSIQVRVSVGNVDTSSSCTSDLTRSVTARTVNEKIRFRLSPDRTGWCAARFSGTVTETSRPICQPGRPCPQFIELTPLGSFSFTVRSH